MGLFKTKQQKELEKKMVIKRTLTTMKQHINELEKQKAVYIAAAKRAKAQGLSAQYQLAVTGLKMTMKQQKKAQEMLLNFELSTQIKDMTAMTKAFLNGMSILSKEMSRLTDSKEFAKIQMEFEKSMEGVQEQGEQMEVFLDSNQSNFDSLAEDETSSTEDKEIAALLDEETSQDEMSDDILDKTLDELEKKIKAGV